MAADIRKTDEIEFAFERAKKILKLNFNKDGVFAGKTHFNDFWARDFCFASLGVTAMGDCDIVKKNIENYLRFQKPNALKSQPQFPGISRWKKGL